MSKRTDVYFDIDYSKLSGVEIGATANNADMANTVSGYFPGGFGGEYNPTGIAVGFRTKF